MTVLSAKHSAFIKWVLPYVAILGACAWSYWSSSHRPRPASPWFMIAVFIFLTAYITRLLRRDLWQMADSVEDRGDRVLVKRGRRAAEILVSDISRVEQEPKRVGSVVTLVLKRPSEFGDTIRFYAPDIRRVPTTNDDIRSLMHRVGGSAGVV
jgi:hypothetical protein